jgi:hypothetical protein
MINALIKLSRARDVVRRDLDVADLSVAGCGWHLKISVTIYTQTFVATTFIRTIFRGQSRRRQIFEML